VLPCDHAMLDITDARAVWSCVLAFKPDVIINPAAITNVDRCERQPDLAWTVNAEAPGTLAAAAERAGARFIHLSTDYVFDGRKGEPYVETDPTAARGVYGQSKIAGERAALAGCQRAYIVRTAWVMNLARPGFLAAMLAAAPSGRARVARQTSSPTGLTDLVEALARMIQARPPGGIYHMVNAGQCSRRELAAEMFRLLGVEVTLDEVSVTEFGGAPRPDYSALRAEAWALAGMPPFRPWQEALAEVLTQVRPG